MDVEKLAAWLVENDYAARMPGYGHPTGEQVAEALLAEFDIAEKIEDAS